MFQAGAKRDERPRIPIRKELQYGIKRELDSSYEPRKKRQKESRHSHYVGVRWNDECKKWYASLHANGKHHYCGLYEHEGDAARAVNAKCGELDIPHKNKGLGIIQIRKKNKQIRRSSRKSAYKGIYWVEKSQSWQVKIKYQKKLHSGGTFQDEYLAAQAANLLCVKLQIPQKNAEIGVEDILKKIQDGKIPPRRPRPRRKSKNNWSTPQFSKVKREHSSRFPPNIPMPTLYPSGYSPRSFNALIDMTPKEVANWLRDLRFLNKYVDQFVQCEISGMELINLDEILLTDFGLPKVFQQRLLSAVANLAANNHGYQHYFPSQKQTLVRKLGVVKPHIMEKHLSMLDDHLHQGQVRSRLFLDPAPTSPPLDHGVPIISTPVKLEAISVIPHCDSTPLSPPALEIPQIKQEKIDEQVLNTWKGGRFMPILETQPTGAPRFNNSPERIIERTGMGQMRVRWKGFGPEDDTEEPISKLQGYDVYKQFLQLEQKQKESKRNCGRPKKKTVPNKWRYSQDPQTIRMGALNEMKIPQNDANEMFEIDWLPLCEMCP